MPWPKTKPSWGTKNLSESVTVIPETACWETTGFVFPKTGYGRVHWKGAAWMAHRAVYDRFVGPIPNDMWVLHKCDNRKCVNPEHLFLGTVQDNVDDMMAKGRFVLSRRAMAKLDEAAVIEIFKASGSQESIAKRYGIKRQAVSKIKLRERWGHITEGINP